MRGLHFMSYILYLLGLHSSRLLALRGASRWAGHARWPGSQRLVHLGQHHLGDELAVLCLVITNQLHRWTHNLDKEDTRQCFRKCGRLYWKGSVTEMLLTQTGWQSQDRQTREVKQQRLVLLLFPPTLWEVQSNTTTKGRNKAVNTHTHTHTVESVFVKNVGILFIFSNPCFITVAARVLLNILPFRKSTSMEMLHHYKTQKHFSSRDDSRGDMFFTSFPLQYLIYLPPNYWLFHSDSQTTSKCEWDV